VILFQQDGDENFDHMPSEWEDYYYAIGSVIDEEAEKIKLEDKIIGKLEVLDIPFDDVVDVMCEDLSEELTEILTQGSKISTVELVLA
jgi:hypothetical protein